MGNPPWGKPQKCVKCYTTAEYTADPVTCYAHPIVYVKCSHLKKVKCV